MEQEKARAAAVPPAPMPPEAAAEAFAALGSSVRLGILRQLVRAGAEGLPVGALQGRLGLPGSTLSHHLRAMVGAGLLEQHRRGRTLICRARYDRIEAMAGFLLSECCADALSACPHPDQAPDRSTEEAAS